MGNKSESLKEYYKNNENPKCGFQIGHKINIGQTRNRGENNGMWKHGRYAIRRIIFEEIKRDFICEICNSIKNIEIHHIDKNPFNNKIENIMILCKSCHSKEHMTKEQMINMLSFRWRKKC